MNTPTTKQSESKTECKKIEKEISFLTAETMDLTISDSSTTISTHPSFASESMLKSPTHYLHRKIALYQRSDASQVRDVLDSMMNNPFNVELQVSSCKLLARISSDEFYCVVIGSSGGILIIINMITAHPDNPKVQAYGCTILGNLCINSYNNKVKISAAKGMHVIVAAMKSHPCVPFVQSSALFALRQLTLSTHVQQEETNAKRAQEIFQITISDDDKTSQPSKDKRTGIC